MNPLPRRILHQSAILQGICTFPQGLFLRSYASTTRQEFGRQFEEIVAQSLRRFSFDVAVCGGPKDRGIDFRGVWSLKSSSVRVIGQCRRYKKRLGPRHVRELEGTLTHEVKGTLGIIVTECGYSKDAYEVFVGSLYPIALTMLKGYSDDLLSWYSSEENNEHSIERSQTSTESDSSHKVQCKDTETPLPEENGIVEGPGSIVTGISNKQVLINDHHLYLTQDEKKLNFTNFNQENITNDNKFDSDISPTSDGHNSFRTSAVDGLTQTSGSADIDADFGQLTNSNISDIGSGVFTMFELNPAARKLFPNLVVGMKYRRHTSKAPELFINEDDSFISVTK